MTGLAGLRVVVAGAGALGSAISWRLQTDGARVIRLDGPASGQSASGVAAGMLAPAFEALLDDASIGRYGLLQAARNEWPDFADGLRPFGGGIERSGALWVADDESQVQVLRQLNAAGAEAQRLSAAQAGRASPGLKAPAGAVHTPEDWRLDPQTLLQALREAFLAEGGQVRGAGLRSIHDGTVGLSDGEGLEADTVVLATGLTPEGLGRPPPELASLQPIKGQIVRVLGAGPRDGPVVRAPGIYVAPGARGPAIGATMEVGVSDRRIDAEVCDRLLALAKPLFPGLAGVASAAAAGVRASTPDGLPMVGPSRVPGVVLAVGARRNGWLLAPMIARAVAEGLAGADCWTPLFDPARFSPDPSA